MPSFEIGEVSIDFVTRRAEISRPGHYLRMWRIVCQNDRKDVYMHMEEVSCLLGFVCDRDG